LSFIAGIIFLDATGSYNATADDLKPILYPLALALVLTPLLCVAVVLEGRKQKKQYLEWCETQNVDFLTRLTSSPEVDDEGKELIIEHLSIINPGWSLK
jgi:hypothetical protein